jgi:hypothetical protein
MSAVQARFDETLRRADDLLRERLRREEQELARQDASLEEARRQRQRANAEARRQIAGVYDDAFRSFGTEVPAAVDDEAPAAYRRRLFNRLARKLAPDHDLARVRADDVSAQPIVFDNFEALIIEAAKREGAKPSFDNLPPSGEMVARHRQDDMGQRVTEFFGRESFLKSMGREGRRVAAIYDRNSGQAIWQAGR